MAGTLSLVFSVVVVFLIVIGVLDVITNYGDNRCEMTYMFERPEYLKVPMKKAVIKRFPNYGLYVYGEGHYARLLSDMRMTGIPVLFIPGNAGSYKQVRSLGSVAFRRAIDKQKRYHFNFFSVDLAEEFSGLYGPVLQEQVEFVHHAIKKIFTLYKKAEVKPKTIVLAGHSMGGMIARALFTLPDFDHQSVNTIFMQATPNQAPVIVLDKVKAEFYQKVNRYWRENANTTLSHITLVSSGGGNNDVQVREGLTPLDEIVDDQHGISMSTTHVPGAWVPADHRCIVWCKQVVFAFVRSLFDIVDEGKKEITNDKEHRMSVFKHHFLQHPGSAGHVWKWPGEITLDKEIKWTVMTDKVWKWDQNEVFSKKYFAMPIAEGEEEIDYVAIVSNVLLDSWVCACELKKGEKQCSTCKDLSSTGNMIPPKNSYKKAVHIDLSRPDLENVTHIVIIVPTSNTRAEIIAEKYNKDSNHLLNSVPGLFEILLAYPESVTTGAMTLDLGSGSFYKLKLHGLTNVMKVYTATLEPSKCSMKKANEHSGSLLHFHVPWSNEDTYEFIRYGRTGNLTLKLQHAPPPPVLFDPEVMDLNFGAQYDHVELLIYLDPSCHYQLRVKASMREMLGQGCRVYLVVFILFLMENPVSNNVDPDQTPHYVASVIWVCTVCLWIFGFPGQWKVDDERLCAVELRLQLRRFCPEQVLLMEQILSFQSRPNFKNVFIAQFVRFYALLMPPFCVATLLMALVYQLRTLHKDGVCPSVLDSIWKLLPFYVVPFATILQIILQLKVVQPYLIKLRIPPPDYVELERQGIWFRGAQFVFYFIALGVTTFQALVVTLVVQFNSRLLGLMLGWLPSAVYSLGKYIGILLSVLSVGAALFVCGSIGVFIPYLILFAQVLRLCYVSRQSEEKDAKSKFNFYMLIFMLWMWVLVLNSPPLLVWGKTISETRMFDILYRDPSRDICSGAAMIFNYLLFIGIPTSGRRTYYGASLAIHILTIMMLVFSLVMLYRVTYVIVISLVLLTASASISECIEYLKDRPKPKTE